MSRRRKKKNKGILTGLGKGKSSGTTKKEPWYKKVLTWVGATILIGVFIVVLIGTAIGLLNPRVSLSESGEFVVEEIRGGVAVVIIHEIPVSIPLEDGADGITPGTRLRVEYLYEANREEIEVSSWSVAEEDATR